MPTMRICGRELFRYVIVLADSGCLIGETGLYPRIGPVVAWSEGGERLL